LKGCDPLMDTVLSPLYWAAGNRVPFDLSFGEYDSPRAVKSNRRLYAMLQQQGAPVACEQRGGLDHFQTHTTLRDRADPWYTRLSMMVHQGLAAQTESKA
jgi:arylformamidase